MNYSFNLQYSMYPREWNTLFGSFTIDKVIADYYISRWF